jgi:hypothetical protein
MQRNAESAAYNFAQYLPQRTKLIQWWANYLERTQQGRVLEMRSA